MASLTTVVGHSSLTSSRILAAFAAGKDCARLVYRNGNGPHVVQDVALRSAPPYGLATFVLSGLAGGVVEYALADYDTGGTAPDPSAVLAGGTRSFRLQPPPGTPPRIAIVSCNDVDNHAFPKAERGALW